MTYTTKEGGTWKYGQSTNFFLHDWHTFKGPCPVCNYRTYDYGGGWACLGWHCVKNVANLVCSNGPEPEWWKNE